MKGRLVEEQNEAFPCWKLKSRNPSPMLVGIGTTREKENGVY